MQGADLLSSLATFVVSWGKDMKLLVAVLTVIAITGAGLVGYSWTRNPDLGPGDHASAVGFTLANPTSGRAWRGLACPHRSIVTTLSIQALGPQLCGTETDGGARARAERFRTEGPTSCWALFEMLSAQNAERFAGVLAGREERGPAVEAVCVKARQLVKG